LTALTRPHSLAMHTNRWKVKLSRWNEPVLLQEDAARRRRARLDAPPSTALKQELIALWLAKMLQGYYNNPHGQDSDHAVPGSSPPVDSCVLVFCAPRSFFCETQRGNSVSSGSGCRASIRLLPMQTFGLYIQVSAACAFRLERRRDESGAPDSFRGDNNIFGASDSVDLPFCLF